jgi:Fe-S-cluster-containing dehydrogenase component
MGKGGNDMPEYGMVIDYKYCTGCHSCEIACRNEKDLPLDQWGIIIAEMGPVKLGDKWLWNFLPTPSHLCDLCVDRIQIGQKPSCELHCLANCIEIVPKEDISKRMIELGEAVVSYIP